MVGAGQQLSGGPHGGCYVVERGGLGAAAVLGPLQHIHQVGDEEVALQRRHALLRQDGRLAAHGAGEGQAVGRDVVLQAPGEQEGGGRRGAEGGGQKGSRRGRAEGEQEGRTRGRDSRDFICHIYLQIHKVRPSVP